MDRVDVVVLALVFLNAAANAVAPEVGPGWVHNISLALAGGSVASIAFLRGLGKGSA